MFQIIIVKIQLQRDTVLCPVQAKMLNCDYEPIGNRWETV